MKLVEVKVVVLVGVGRMLGGGDVGVVKVKVCKFMNKEMKELEGLLVEIEWLECE